MIGPALLLVALAAGSSDRVVLRLERLTNCGGWKVAIHESGHARGELFNACHPGGPKKVTVRQSLKGGVAGLRSMVEREHFARLEERPHEDNPIVDDEVCFIEVSFGASSHSVFLSGQQLTDTGPELEPFRRVWRFVQALVPEPDW